MRLIFGLFIMATIAIGFFVWRAIARSPKLDKLFNFTKREDTASDILVRQKDAAQDLNTRGRALGKRQSDISKELNKIKKNQ